MADDIDTLAEAGTEEVVPESDTAEEWDYYDPDEDQDTEETQDEATDDDGADADEEPETDEEPNDETEEEAAQAAPEYDLGDGTKVKPDELVKGYLRQQDYTRKSQAVAEQRKSAETEVQRIQGITESFIDHLTTLVPDAPNANLAMQDPQAYVIAKAQHDAAMEQVQKLIEVGTQAKEQASGMTDAKRQEVLQSENAALIEKFPEVAEAKGREQFFNGAAEAAQNVGFDLGELGGVSDHRYFALAHWASIGMKASKAREAARSKTAKAPRCPAQTRTGRAKSQSECRGDAKAQSLRLNT